MDTIQPERVNGSHPAAHPPPAKMSRAERQAADELARVERDRIREEARRARERDQEKWAAERDQLRAERKRDRKTRSSAERRERIAAWQARAQRWWHAFVLVGAIVGVNVVAIMGQVTAFQADPFGWPLLGALGAAAVIESIAIYVGYHAHVALIEGDSVMRLRLASYGIAGGVGALNYHHYSPDWSLSDLAVMFGAASVLSPWLWAIHSRHQHRQVLRAQGLIDPRAPKFSGLRWLLWRRETWQALRWAVRYSEQSPAAAMLGMHRDRILADADRMAGRARGDLAAAQATLIRAQSDALAVLELLPGDAQETSAEITDGRADETADETPIETSDETGATPAMWAHWQKVVEVERRIPSGAELATVGKCSPQYGAKKAREWQADMDGRTRHALQSRKRG
ncbi:hypothetical protein [Nonomuraea sp. SBT364]|uniref:hypothetical protein n=1 Tax=Nonomuraea sp. SBT364 TaxID=1580530 RepID=UPI00066A72F9|nr:hypothetical protein [Nonomuraea sp. SBT364]